MRLPLTESFYTGRSSMALRPSFNAASLSPNAPSINQSSYWRRRKLSRDSWQELNQSFHATAWCQPSNKGNRGAGTFGGDIVRNNGQCAIQNGSLFWIAAQVLIAERDLLHNVVTSWI